MATIELINIKLYTICIAGHKETGKVMWTWEPGCLGKCKFRNHWKFVYYLSFKLHTLSCNCLLFSPMLRISLVTFLFCYLRTEILPLTKTTPTTVGALLYKEFEPRQKDSLPS